MTKRMGTAAIIGSTFGCDACDLAEYRYQPTRTPRAVYAISDRYFTVAAKNPTGLLGRTWIAHGDQFFAEQAGTVLWVAEGGEE